MVEERKKGYHIPAKQVVLLALHNVLRTNPAVSSQEKMLFLMSHELKEADSTFVISGPRLRRIAMQTGFVSIETKCSETRQRRDLQVCPVCCSNTDIVKNQTLYGGSVSLEHRCPVCGYWSGLYYRKPIRYRFMFREKQASPKEEK